MQSMKYALVTTTIRLPKLLDDYCRNFIDNDYQEVEIIVIGDKKTPAGLDSFCNDLSSKYGYMVEYWGVEKQKNWLRDFPEFAGYLPWNSIERRSLGYILAYMRGNDVIISIDDDNYVLFCVYTDRYIL